MLKGLVRKIIESFRKILPPTPEFVTPHRAIPCACRVHRVAPKVVAEFVFAYRARYCRTRVNMERERPKLLHITGKW